MVCPLSRLLLLLADAVAPAALCARNVAERDRETEVFQSEDGAFSLYLSW